MLTEIRIEALGAISAATAEFGRGLTVLTGETGTGKTMVVTSLHPGLHPLHSAALRFAEACIGKAVAVLAVRVWRGPGAG